MKNKIKVNDIITFANGRNTNIGLVSEVATNCCNVTEHDVKFKVADGYKPLNGKDINDFSHLVQYSDVIKVN